MKYLASLFISFLLLACGTKQSQEQTAVTLEADKDYFAEKAEIRYAENFSVSYHNNYKLVRTNATFYPSGKEGDSKMSSGIFKEAFFGVIYLKLQSFFKKSGRKQKIV